MDWFLYNRDLCHERVKMLFIHHTPKVCSYMLQSIIRFSCFFSIWLSFHKYSQFKGQQVNEDAISLNPFYHYQPLHRSLEISPVIAAESLHMRIAGIRTRTGNLLYTLFIICSFYTCTGSCCC